MDMETSGEQQTSQLAQSILDQQTKELEESRRNQEEYEKLRNTRSLLEDQLKESKKAEDSFVEQLLRSKMVENEKNLKASKHDMQQILRGQTFPGGDHHTGNRWVKILQSVFGFFSNRQSSCQRCQQQDQEHRQTMEEIVKSYEGELAKERSALKNKEEELMSLKNRVAKSMASRPHNVEDMSSPVNQSRLGELYNKLRLNKWPDYLHEQHGQQKLKKEHIQKVFVEAVKEAEKMKQSITAVCGAEDISTEVEKFRQTALENLQLALYHSSKQDVFKATSPQFDEASAQLASECYWLGCLMALHSPPLRPHWDESRFSDREPFPQFKQTKSGK